MKVCILGATGRVGSNIINLALKDSAEVTALARDLNRIEIQHERLRVIEGNVLNEEDIKKAIEGSDIVISALGTDQNRTLAKSMPQIIKQMEEAGVHQNYYSRNSRYFTSKNKSKFISFPINGIQRKTTTAAEDHLAAYKVLSNSNNLCWTVVCPTHLIDGEATEVYRTEKDILPEGGSKITVGDTAHFAWDLCKKNIYENSRVGIAY
ncbi:NAD(P)-dependent oxidoreductase [Bacillus cereus]